MRALVLDDSVRLEPDYPSPGTPALPEGEALVRVRQAGICNTDLELIKGYAEFRGVLGHEFVGVVEACPLDPGWVGQRVVGEINAYCGVCSACRAGRPTHCPSRTALGIRGRNGVFADFATLPVKSLHAVPDSVSDDQAVFTEPLAAAVSITDLTHVRPSERVIVLGDGKLGQLIAQVLALTGCDLAVVGRHQEKLNLLSARGIKTHLADRAPAAPQAEADIVIEATGTPTGFAAAQGMVRPRGKLVLKSTYHDKAPADLTRVVVNELHIIGTRCGPFPSALRLLEQGLINVESLIRARFPLDQGVLALEKAAEKGILKVLLEM
jgi:threonine dehydrogenase-like Zn-dependent dehydrogenase